MSLELRSNSPRCFCGKLWIDRKKHLKENHAEIVFYHLLVQIGRLLKLSEIILTNNIKSEDKQ